MNIIDKTGVFEFCKSENLIGFGWGLPDDYIHDLKIQTIKNYDDLTTDRKLFLFGQKGCHQKLFNPAITATAGNIIKITFKQLLPFPFKGIKYKQSCLSRISDGTVFQI